MEIVNKTLFLISDGMLVPVMVLLILFFARSLMLIGGFFSMAVKRVKDKNRWKICFDEIAQGGNPKEACKAMCKKATIFEIFLEKIIENSAKSEYSQKILADARLKFDKECEHPKMIMRIGPMLGLMGTLIPMGTALTGLATGRIDMMAFNMQIAFATTVVGLFCGITGFVLNSVLRRWYSEDIINLNYIQEILENGK